MQDYMVLIKEPEWDPAAVTEADWIATGVAHRAFTQAVRDAGGEVLDGDALQPSATAVRIEPEHDDIPAVFTDGPFTEVKEIVSGYYKIRVADAATARELAALCPTGGAIELWPIFDTSGF